MSTGLCGGGRSTPRTTLFCSRLARVLRILWRSAPKEKRHEPASNEEGHQTWSRHQILRRWLWKTSGAQPLQEGAVGQSQRTSQRGQINEGSSRGGSFFLGD